MEYKEHKKFLEVEELMCREFYDYYRQNRKRQAKGINQYKLFIKAFNGMMITLNKISSETEGGIHIDKLGYFCRVKTKHKMIKPMEKSLLKKYEKSYGYSYEFLPDNWFKDWHMYVTVTYLNKLEKYTLHFDAIESYYKATIFSNDLERMGSKTVKY